VVNQKYRETLCEDNFVVPKVKLRYHGPAISKIIPFQRADATVRFVDASALVCNARGVADDASSAGGASPRPVSPGALQAAIIRAQSENKAKRLSQGRMSPAGNIGGSGGAEMPEIAPEIDDSSVVSDITVASNFSQSDAAYVREHRRFALTKSNRVKGDTVITEEMLRLNARLTVSYVSNLGLKEQSLRDPAVLVGYQVRLLLRGCDLGQLCAQNCAVYGYCQAVIDHPSQSALTHSLFRRADRDAL
jgi:hypothetical protein